MPAARYWRIVGIETYGGGDLELSELQLYADGARADVGATLTCTHAPGAGSVANLQDDNTATTCRFSEAAVKSGGFALQWDCGSAKNVIGVRVGTGSTIALCVASLTLEYFFAGAWMGQGSTGRYSYPGPNSMLPAPAEGDSTYANNALLLPADGADGSTTIVDLSPSPKVFTAQGNAALSTAKTLFGRATLQLDGNGDSITATPDSSLIFGTGDFTIGWWSWKSGNGRDGYDRVIHTSSDAADTNGFLVELSSTRGLMMYGNNGLMLGPIATNPNTSDWLYWEICRVAGVIYGFRHGALIGSASNTTNITVAGQLRIGARHIGGSEAYYFNGYLQGLRVKKGVGLHTVAFTPPDGPFPSGYASEMLPLLTRTNRAALAVSASSSTSAHAVRNGSGVQLARDTEFGGLGRIYGFTKIETSPGTKVPTKARVALLRQRDKLLARETWSDPVTGAWEVQGIDTAQEFIAVAEDADGNYRPVAANKTVPEAV